MIQIKDYVRPATLEDAMTVLTSSRNAVVIGGGAYLRLGKKYIHSAIDLSGLGLNTIEDSDDWYTVGAMVTFGDLERSEPLHREYHGLFYKSLSDVVGVQLRNTVTVGGTVYSRYGFSDLLVSLLALDTEVLLHRQGKVKLETFLQQGSQGKDILTHIKIPKGCTAASYQSARLSTMDYAALNLAVAKIDGRWRVAVGARPGRAVLAHGTMDILNNPQWNDETLLAAAESISRELTYGSNTRGSARYRRLLAASLLKKAMKEVQTHADTADC